jgi:hypothetical protein
MSFGENKIIRIIKRRRPRVVVIGGGPACQSFCRP